MVPRPHRAVMRRTAALLPGLQHLCGATLGPYREVPLPSGGLAIKPAWVAGTPMGVVLALLAMEVRAVIIVTATVLGTKALL